MEYAIKDQVYYITAIVSEFALRYGLNTQQAYRYLSRFGGIDFVTRHYGVEHTLPFDDVIEDLSEYCQRRGGAVA